jgi:hypothetical protein
LILFLKKIISFCWAIIQLDRAHSELEGIHERMARKDLEIQRIREGAAHHRQRAVEARLELQEMRGSQALRTSRMRRSKEREKEVSVPLDFISFNRSFGLL